MNYTKMSNFEINKAVLKISIPYEDICETEQIGHGESVSWGDGYNLYIYNPCNSWTDAGPIIQKYGISLYYIGGGHERGSWGAENPSGEIYTYNDNLLRAAMIVFLMMQEKSDE